MLYFTLCLHLNIHVDVLTSYIKVQIDKCPSSGESKNRTNWWYPPLLKIQHYQWSHSYEHIFIVYLCMSVNRSKIVRGRTLVVQYHNQFIANITTARHNSHGSGCSRTKVDPKRLHIKAIFLRYENHVN